jgi:hypothetical protein
MVPEVSGQVVVSFFALVCLQRVNGLCWCLFRLFRGYTKPGEQAQTDHRRWRGRQAQCTNK